MSILNRFNRYVRHYRDTVNRRRTERMIGSLPLEIRKDIGWPGQYRYMQAPADFDTRSIGRI